MLRFAQALANATTTCVNSLAEAPLRNPITGIFDCCAPAASGHASAAPPSSVMNVRRFIISASRTADRKDGTTPMLRETAALPDFTQLMTAVGQNR